jgi:anti-sigma regulatory factor (Ser/Thr protein kinase)
MIAVDADATATVSQTFAAEQSQLEAIDAWIEQVGKAWQIPDATRFRARVCAAEIGMNAITHGGADPALDAIEVTLHNRNPALGMAICDTTRPFDPTRDAPAGQDREAGEAGGYGLVLVRSFAKDMRYRRDGGRNILQFTLAASP